MQHHNRAPLGSIKEAVQKADHTKMTLKEFVQQSGLNYSSVAIAARTQGIKFLDGRRRENKPKAA